MLVAFAGCDPQHGYSVGGVVGVPMTPPDDGELAWPQDKTRSASVVQHGKFRSAGKDEKQLVAFSMELPWGPPTERSNGDRASVEPEVPDGALAPSSALQDRFGPSWRQLQDRCHRHSACSISLGFHDRSSPRLSGLMCHPNDPESLRQGCPPITGWGTGPIPGLASAG
jgi:hypothetical protein